MRFWILTIAAATAIALAGEKKDDPNKLDREKMQGDWAAVIYVVDGQALADDDAQSFFRTVKGDRYTVFHFDKPLGKGTFKIDATKQPKTIDAWPANAPDKSKPLLGIYEFAGEKYKVCFAAPGKPRPTEFSSKEGSGNTLTVWEREKKQ
jgi:uncharacterized protein (TIGR03067 family)